MFDYDDFYYEPSEYDMLVDDFKKALMKSVKEEFLQEMNRLQKENEELKEIKDNWEKLEKEYKQKERDLNWKFEQERKQIARKRLSELFASCGMNTVLYRPKTISFQKEKCNKCDEKRYIYFKSPSGKDMKEPCQCAKFYYKYVPEKYHLIKFHQHLNSNNAYTWYEEKDINDVYDSYSYICDFVYNNENFNELYEKHKKNVFFEDENKCQEYCDWLNQKEESDGA